MSLFVNDGKKITETDWETTKNYDEVMVAIGRNRKLLLNKFLNLEQRKVKITFEVAKEVFVEVLESCKLRILDNKNWEVLLRFAEKKGAIDFRMLIDVYKEKVNKVMSPRAKIVFI